MHWRGSGEAANGRGSIGELRVGPTTQVPHDLTESRPRLRAIVNKHDLNTNEIS